MISKDFEQALQGGPHAPGSLRIAVGLGLLVQELQTQEHPQPFGERLLEGDRPRCGRRGLFLGQGQLHPLFCAGFCSPVNPFSKAGPPFQPVPARPI